MSDDIEPKKYIKQSSIPNAEKARLARRKKYEDRVMAKKIADEAKEKVKDTLETEDSDYSDDEIVYIPTKKAQIVKKPKKEPVIQTLPDHRVEIEELRKQLSELKTQTPVEKPVEKSVNSEITNHLKNRILNF